MMDDAVASSSPFLRVLSAHILILILACSHRRLTFHRASTIPLPPCSADNTPGGLQLQMKDGTWRDVAIPEDCFTINLGDLMQRWTNDRWKSTVHRVVPPPVDVSACVLCLLPVLRVCVRWRPL